MNTSCLQSLALIGLLVSLPAAGTLHAQTHAENFEDGSIAPFTVEKIPGNTAEIVTPTDFSARSGDKVFRIVWHEENYNERRSGRSVEGNSSRLERITGEGWYGFSFYAPESFPVPDKSMVLGQIICWDHSLPKTNITITVGVDHAGAVILEGAYGVGDGGKDVTVYTTLSPKLVKGVWHDVILYCKFSRNHTGILRAWYDGAPQEEPTAEYTGINLGNGGWTGDEQMAVGGYIKWGPYCWEHWKYTPGESREIFYDEIAYQVGNPADGFDRVKPEAYGTPAFSPAPAQTVLCETFDVMPTGAKPAGWETHADASSSVSVRETPGATDKSIRFWDDNPSGSTGAWKTFAPQSGPVTASWDFMETGATPGHRMELLHGTTPAVSILSDGQGNLVYRQADDSETVLAAPAANQWHRLEIAVDPAQNLADVSLDGTPVLTGAPLQNQVPFVDRVSFGSSEPSTKRHLFINNVCVRPTPSL